MNNPWLYRVGDTFILKLASRLAVLPDDKKELIQGFELSPYQIT